MSLSFKLLKLIVLALLYLTMLSLKFAGFVFLAFLGGLSDDVHKSIYMMNEEDTDEIIDDGVSLGYELDSPLKSRNYP